MSKDLMGAYFCNTRCFFCWPVEKKKRKMKRGLMRAIISIMRCFFYGRVEKLRKIKKDLMEAIVTLIKGFICELVVKLRKIKKDLMGVIISAIRWLTCVLIGKPRKIKGDEFSLARIYPESKEIENVEEREEEVLKMIEAGVEMNSVEQIQKNQEACLLPELHFKKPTEKKQGICLDTFRNSTDASHDRNDIEFEEYEGHESSSSTSHSLQEEVLISSPSFLSCKALKAHGSFKPDFEVSGLDTFTNNNESVEEKKEGTCLPEELHFKELMQKKKEGSFVNELEESIEKKRELDESIKKKQGACLLDELPCVEPTENVEEREQGDTKSVVTEEGWISHYSSFQKILLVGEGDFSFSASLAMAFGSASNMIATSLDSVELLRTNYRGAMTNIKKLASRGCRVLHGVDVKHLANNPLLKGMIFDRIIFNFPFSGFVKTEPLRGRRRLVSLFLKNAKEMINDMGEIHVTQSTKAFDSECNIEQLASCHQLKLIEVVDFNCMDYPCYSTRHGFGGDDPFLCNPSKTYKFGHKNAATKGKEKNSELIGKKQNAHGAENVHFEKCVEHVGAKEREVIMGVVAEKERGSNSGRNSVSISQTRWVEKVYSERCVENVEAKGHEVVTAVVAKEDRGSNRGCNSILIPQARLVAKGHSEKCIENIGAKGEEVTMAVAAREERGSNRDRNSVLIPQTLRVEKVHSEKCIRNVGAKEREVIMSVVEEEERGSKSGRDSVLIPQTHREEKVLPEKCIVNVGGKGQEVIMDVVAEEERGSKRGRDRVVIPQTRLVEKVNSEKCIENVGGKGQEVIIGVAAEEGRGSHRGRDSILTPQTHWVEKIYSDKSIENVGAKRQEVVVGVATGEERGSNRVCDSVLIPQARWVEKVHYGKCIENVGVKGQEGVAAEVERGTNEGYDSVLIPQKRWVAKVHSDKCVKNVGAEGQEVIVGDVAEKDRGINSCRDSVLISQTRRLEKVHSENCIENVGGKGQEVIMVIVAEEEKGSHKGRDSVLTPQTHLVEKEHSEKCVKDVGAEKQEVIVSVAAEEEKGSNRGCDSVLIPETRWVEKVHSGKCTQNVAAKGQDVIMGMLAEDRRGCDSVLVPKVRWVAKVHSEKCTENVGVKGQEVTMGVAAEVERGSNRGQNSVLIPQTGWVAKVHTEKCVKSVRAKEQEVVVAVVTEEDTESNRRRDSVLIPRNYLDSFQDSTSTDASRDQNDIGSEECQDNQSNSSTSLLHDQNDIKIEECQDFGSNLSTSGPQELEVVHFNSKGYPCYSTSHGFGDDDSFVGNPSKTYEFVDEIASIKRKGNKNNSEQIKKKQNALWVEKVHYKECFENVGTKGKKVIVGVAAKEDTGSNKGHYSCLDSFKNSKSTDTSYEQNEIEFPECQDCISNLSTASAGILHDQNDTRSEECQDYLSNSSTSILHDQNDVKFEEFQDYQSNLSTSGSQEQEVFNSAASSPYSEDPNLSLEVSDLCTSNDFTEEKKRDACLLEKQHTNGPNEKKQEGCSLFQKHSEEPTERKQDARDMFFGTIKIKQCLCSSEEPCLEESLENQHGACLPEAFHFKGPIENFEEQVDTKGVMAEERWISHYSSSQKILLVGEGDFSFSASLAKGFGSATHMIATSLDSEEFLCDHYLSAIFNIKNLTSWGCRVLHGVDATKMVDNQLLKGMKFDRIIFNFPFAGFFKNEWRNLQLWRHQHLVSMFLENAKEMINETGEIHITHKTNGFHSEWNIVELATCHGLRLVEAVNFNCSDYPGYNTKCGFGGDNNFDCNPSKTYKFGLNNAKNASDKKMKKKKKKKEKDFRLQADLSWSLNRTMMDYGHVLPPYLDYSHSGVFQPMALPPYLDCSPLDVFQPTASSAYLSCSPSISLPMDSPSYLDYSRPGLFQPMASPPYLDCSPPGVFESTAPFAGVSQQIAPFSDLSNANHPFSSTWSL